jgi:hypothetical protein
MKQYNGEKAIISLTSWKARINSVYATIFSIIKHNPGFHIVLVLSENEFPNKEADLPDKLREQIKYDVIEVIWTKRNYKVFKKIIPTMAKYPNVPIISADDGIVYIRNFAEILYTRWLRNQDCIFVNEVHHGYNISWGAGGWGTIYPPNAFKDAGLKAIELDEVLNTNHDDALYGVLAAKFGIKVLQNDNCPFRYYQIAKETRDGISSSMNRRHCYSDTIIPRLKKICEPL